MNGGSRGRAKRVLVTGAAGFVGARLCDRLTRDAVEVHGVSRQVRAGGGVHWWQADLSDATETQRVIAEVQPEVVFHLAGLPSASRELGLVLPTLEQNLVAAVNVMVGTAETGTGQVILAGSFEETGMLGGDGVPSSPYAVSKQAASAYAQMLHALHGLPVVTARIFMVYGPGQADPGKLVPYVTTSLLRGESPQLGSGERLVDWIYVDDVAEALVTIAGTPGLSGETIDVGSGQLVTIRSLVEQIVAILNPVTAPTFGALPDRKHETVSSANVARTLELTGWQAQTQLEAGLQATVQWHRDRLA